MSVQEKKVAVIGSGLAGLTTAWVLSNPTHFSSPSSSFSSSSPSPQNQGGDLVPENLGSTSSGAASAGLPSPPLKVHLFEKSLQIGMDAASVPLESLQQDSKLKIDVPMRGFFPSYYPTLARFYRLIGIDFKKRNHTVIFCRTNEKNQTLPIFSYRNILRSIFGFGIPIPDLHEQKVSEVFGLAYDWLRFFYWAHKFTRLSRQDKGHLVAPSDQTIHEFLLAHNFNRLFIYDSLYAMLTGICTCPFEDCMAYPAGVILEFYGTGVLFEGTSAVTGGVQRVCQVLAEGIQNIHLNTPISSIEKVERDGQVKLLLTTENGTQELFDAVILASQANQALSMLKNPAPEQREALQSFKYVKTPTYVHTDESVMPSDRKYWRGLNVVSCPNLNSAMSTMYMNDIMPDLLKGKGDVFQTVLPSVKIREDRLISVTNFERVVVNKKSVQGLELLRKHQGTDNIYFVGSYAFDGIPLLEGCVCSALDVAEKLGVRRDLVFKETPPYHAPHFSFWGQVLSVFLFFFTWLLDLVF